jgi:5'-nucleotidase (lipoprotein e(P4) family)
MLLVSAVTLAAGLAQAAAAQPRNHEILTATLWAQTAVEHDAICLQAYRQAHDLLDRALKEKKWTAALEQTGKVNKLPPAVILDIDETVLDNSASQARAVLRDAEFTTASWDEWVSESAAGALPGALAFTLYARSRGVTVFFISNRDARHEEATRRNLMRLGFPLDAAKGPATDTVLTRGERPEWNSEKTTRRQYVAQSYRVLLLIGDDLGDFLSNVRASVSDRRRMAAAQAEMWGTRWLMLPNPMYGSWESALYDHDFSLSRRARLERRIRMLNTGEARRR